MSQALYRRYRPDSFADVVGQEHVTTPLMQALRADKVNHAYLFSGPRGCGKTTSARILARCLNCAEGPTDTPCGTCESCVELARGGSGSVDVVEIDAASHNGVDDARELRERAAFAPARDRYKIFILDEAHMVTPQGFNALLKLVEEPPPHIRFIFATTEPDKVIGTIRSRTHHYPFRLVPPSVLTDYLGQLCEAESVSVASGVLDLVVRAGGGSVRDTLSVLDQLIAGSDEGGVTYDRAIALLGFTDATLLDDAVDAIAAADGASLFDVVGRVIQTGHEPRRFVEDLLERVRDLLVIAASGAAGAQALGEVPADQLERMTDQARRLGLARASRSGDLINDALTHMVGATSPRLHLELLCARLLAADVPAAAGAAVGTSGGAAPSPAASPHAGAGATAASDATSGTPSRTGGPAAGGADARSAIQAAKDAMAAARAGTPSSPSSSASGPSRPAPEPQRTPEPERPTGPAPWEEPEEIEPPLTASAAAANAAAARTAHAPASTPPARPAEPDPEPDWGPPAQTSTPQAPAVAAATEPTPVNAAPGAAPAGGAGDAELLRRRWSEVLGTLERRRVTWSMVSQSAQVASVEGGVLTLAFDNSALAGRFTGSSHAENVALAVRETLGLQVRVEATTGPISPGTRAAVPAAGASGAAGAGVAAFTVPADDDVPPEPDDEEVISEHDAQAPDSQLSGADVVAQMLGGTIIEP